MSFKWSPFGYRRSEVSEALAARDARILGLAAAAQSQSEATADLEAETTSLAGMVLEREREIRLLGQRLREANDIHDRSIASLDAITARLEELEAQARGQATRIRMKALREAVEVSKKVKALTDAEPALREQLNGNGLANGDSGSAAPERPGVDAGDGRVRLEVGPLGDFSQLVGFEDAVGRLGASEISVERFSEGRATLSMRIDRPADDLLGELEDLSILDFKVRRTTPDNLILDVDDDSAPDQRAA